MSLAALAADIFAALRETPLRPLPEQESESGLGTARALTTIMDQLAAQTGGAPLSPADQQLVFALALSQVDAHGRRVTPGKVNKPDISFIADADGAKRRVNIEIETANLRKHYDDVNKDGNAHNVFIKIDPWTGAFKGGIVREPGGKVTHLSTAAEVQRALAQLPRAQRDPTLAVNKKGAQVRRLPRPTPVRPMGATRAARPAARTRMPAATRGRPRTRGAREFEWEWEIDGGFESELGRAADEMEG